MPKILFIEDEADQIMLTRARLEAAGLEFIAAADGEEGLSKIRQEKPDLVILDVILPRMDGLEVCRRLKDSPDTGDIPVIMITASGEKDIEQKCRAAGADDYIIKPYESNDLLKKLKTLLDQ